MVRGPRSVDRDAASPAAFGDDQVGAAACGPSTGSSTTRSASRSLTLIENQRKNASRSETSFRPGFRRSSLAQVPPAGRRSSRRHGGVGSRAPVGVAGAAGGAGGVRSAAELHPTSSRCSVVRSVAGVDVARDLALAHQRDRAVLLGHHDRDRVGLLGEADGGAVARAERLRDAGWR